VVAVILGYLTLDTGRRSDRYGRPRKGVLHLQEDGPLEPELYRLAMRSRLFLPLGRVLRTAQLAGGYAEDTLPECHCLQPCGSTRAKSPRFLDVFGCHCASRTAASGYTPRHHRYNEAFTALLRRAGYSSSIEVNPFKDLSDRVTRPQAAPLGTATAVNEGGDDDMMGRWAQGHRPPL
jgi:hypothetical protein